MSSPSEVDPVATELTGKVPAEAVHPHARIAPKELMSRFEALSDLSGTISDVLDEIGIDAAIGASVLVARSVGARVVGQALTVRNVTADHEVHEFARQHLSQLAEIEGHNQALPGDVLVIQGVSEASNMGGISASIAKRQGEKAAIVDGGTRDTAWQREIGFPVWSREVTPVTGKWRAKTVEINGPVEICGIRVEAGDIVVADDTGVCFVPYAIASSVVERAEQIASGEAQRHDDIDSGLPVPELSSRTYAYEYPAAE